jgi:hypothetical protein
MAYPKIQKDLEDYLDNISSFKKIWKEKCSKYNSDMMPSILPAVKRIIVIGDIHGDMNMTIKVLKLAKLIDKNNSWIGGETVVVQVGDMVDRCRYSGIPCNMKGATENDEGNDWKILQFFTKLHKEAIEVGGAVYSLVGNHELMNVRGDFRYVSYEGLREFDNYKKSDGNVIEDGETARRWAFAPGNDISEFLACTRQMALIIGKNLFAHAGVLPKIAKKYSVTRLNQILSLYLLNMVKSSDYTDIFDSSESSPLWNRVYGNMGLKKTKELEEDCDDILLPLKKLYKVGKIYVGHTPMMTDGISSVCDGKVWLTDVGLSGAFDKFDKTISESEDNSRNEARMAQVLEILDDGKEINILK